MNLTPRRFGFVAVALLLASMGGAPTEAGEPEEGVYVLDLSLKTRNDQAYEPLGGADITLSGPVGASGAGVLSGYAVTSDAAGKATVRLRLPGTYSLTANHAGYETGRMIVVVSDPKFPKYLSWTLRRTGVVGEYRLVVDVFTQAGAAVGGALVRLTGPASASGSTGPEGACELVVPLRGQYQVHVFHPNFTTNLLGEVSRPVSFTTAGETKTEHFIFRPRESGMMIEVFVADEQGNGVPGATASPSVLASQGATTNAFGKAWFLFRNPEALKSATDAVEISVTHPEYEPGSATVTPVLGGFDRYYPVAVTLRRRAGLHRVWVEVFEAGTHAELMDVHVVMNGRTPILGVGGRPADFLSGNTDGQGRIAIVITKGDTFDLTLSRGGYKSVSDAVTISDAGEPDTLSYELEPTGLHTLHRMLRVVVSGMDAAGRVVRVKGATVDVSTGQSGVTDAGGNVSILHREAPGETLRVAVTPPPGSEWKPGADGVLIRANGTLFDEDKIEDAAFKAYLKRERQRILKEAPRDSDIPGRIADALGNSWGKAFTQPFADEFARAFGPHAVDEIAIRLDRIAATLEGSVVLNKGAVKVGETVRAAVGLFWRDGAMSELTVQEIVELFGPGGGLVTNNISLRVLKQDPALRGLKPAVYDRHELDIVCAKTGTYTVKATVTGPDGLTWTDQASFVVSPAAPTVEAKSAPAGVFKLVDRVIGHAAPPDKGPYGTWSGSVGESSFTGTFEGAAGYDNHVSLSATWSTPAAEIRPGDTIELTIVASASVTGKDHGFNQIEAFWSATGNAQVVEEAHAFAGIASSGKLFPSGSGKYRIKIGTSGEFRLYSSQNNGWGSGGVWRPCEYTYVFDAAASPTTPADAGGKTTMTPSESGPR